MMVLPAFRYLQQAQPFPKQSDSLSNVQLRLQKLISM